MMVAVSALAAPAAFVPPPTALSRPTFRVDAKPFRTASPLFRMDGAAAGGLETIAQMEARLTELVGAENKGKRRRLRDRISKSKAQTPEDPDVFGEAKAALHTVELPSATKPPASPPKPPRQRPRARSPPRGWSPNIGWRAVSMGELREHPAFIALPPASRVTPATPADIALLRQDSRQWWACHAGRISTSACASCLGVYEERSGQALGVPPSLRGHNKALDAHSRLASPMLEDMSLLSPENWDDDDGDVTSTSANAAVWRAHRDDAAASASPFLCEYRPPARRKEAGGGRRAASEGARQFRSVGQIRMAWGTVQEATSILAALNYLSKLNATVEEAGLQPLEALGDDERAALPAGLPPIGASPDGIVRWPDGRVEPFEVKNHAPYANNPKRHEEGAPPFQIRDPGPYDEVAIWHVPQLYLHMLCLGSKCSSALFMSASATRGVNLFRLHRDEALMDAMLRLVARFAAEYGSGRPPPEPDYFWGTAGYAQLLDGLRRASRENVELVAHIPDAEVQRGRGQRGDFFVAS